MQVIVLNPTGSPGRKSSSEPTWAASAPFVVARGAALRTEHGPSVSTAVRVTENGETKVVNLDLPSWTKFVSGGETVCPIFGDTIPWKSFTTVVDAADLDDAIYSCEFVHGTGSVSKTKALPDGKVAIRSDYKAW